MQPKIQLESWGYTAQELFYTWRVGIETYTSTLVYDDTGLDELVDRYGLVFFSRIILHIAAIDACKFLSRGPACIDFGPLAELVTPELVKLFAIISWRVGGQWRYTHKSHPEWDNLFVAKAEPSQPVEFTGSTASLLLFSGGGKDSLLSAKLLEEMEVDFSTFGYSKNVYGDSSAQHDLLNATIDCAGPKRRHRLTAVDTYLTKCDGLDSITEKDFFEAETPWSLFASLPIALVHGYSVLLLGNERSADKGNLVWKKTGEEINHQWGKSLEAQTILESYIRDNLIRNLTAASILKPVYDTVIFSSLRNYEKDLASTHSCNIEKPWCRKCPKCAYVLLGFHTYLSSAVCEQLQTREVLADPDNLIHFVQMLGLSDHTPFECIGESGEVQLMFEILRKEERLPLLLRSISTELSVDHATALLGKYSDIKLGDVGLPSFLETKLSDLLMRESKRLLSSLSKHFHQVHQER